MDAGTHLVLSEAQGGRLRAAGSGSLAWQAAVELMLDLGLRRSEMFALRAGDVDLVKRRICRPRRLPIPAGLLDHLRLLVECLDEEELVFSGNWYHPRVRREWRDLTRHAGVEGVGMHVLRTTCFARRTAVMVVLEDPLLRRRAGEKGAPAGREP